MTCNVYKFKAGDTLWIPMTLTKDGVPEDITGWTIRSQIRYAKRLISELTVVIDTPSAGSFTISDTPTNTQAYPDRECECDVQFTRADGRVVSSQTFNIEVERDVTHD